MPRRVNSRAANRESPHVLPTGRHGSDNAARVPLLAGMRSARSGSNEDRSHLSWSGHRTRRLHAGAVPAQFDRP